MRVFGGRSYTIPFQNAVAKLFPKQPFTDFYLDYMISLLSRILLIAVVAAFFPFLASDFFNAPILHGVISFDVLILAILFKRSPQRLLRQIPFCIICFLYAYLSNSLDAYTCAGIYFVWLWIFYVIRNRFLRTAIFFLSLLAIFIADWSVFFDAAFSMSLSDLFGIAKFYWWGILLFFFVPIIQASLTGYFFRHELAQKSKNLSDIPLLISLGLILAIHFTSGNLQQRISILDFPLRNFAKNEFQPGHISHNSHLRADIQNHYPTENHLNGQMDSLKPTVMILIESWGVRKNFALNDSEFSVFSQNEKFSFGILERTASYTQGAEWEDFHSPGGKASDSNLPRKYKNAGYETWYIHGYNGDFYDRNKNYSAFGFDSLKFKEELQQSAEQCHYGFKGICDSAMAKIIDSLLADSAPKFIYWTTLDSHPPYETQNIPSEKICVQNNLSKIECIHEIRISNTLKIISELAKKHPEYRFIVRGDHRPMGSLQEKDFVTSFYYRWVPIAILNF